MSKQLCQVTFVDSDVTTIADEVGVPAETLFDFVDRQFDIESVMIEAAWEVIEHAAFILRDKIEEGV
jgi:hypothetical protein